MTIKEMQNLVENNASYEDVIVPFTFANEMYESQVNYAYFNSLLDSIYSKYELEYDETDMLTEPMTVSNYNKFMKHIVEKMYEKNYDLLYAQKVVKDILELFNHIIFLFDKSHVISHDLSLTAISKAMEKDKRIYDLFMTEHCNEKMTPEQIRDKRKWILKELKELEVPGISELLRSEAGIKADQLLNMFFGLHMRVKANDKLNEIYPRYVPERWIDGLRSKDSIFIEGSIQRLAAILNSQTMQSSGTHNKDASILAQDMEIVEMDCGSANFMEYTVDDMKDLQSLRFKYMLTENGLKEITLDDKHLIGKRIKIRSVLKCACESGICATCYGANAKWNLSNAKYRFDVGFVSARYMNSKKSQKVLSVKHSSTPILVDGVWYITDMETGEIITIEGNDKTNDFFTREFNKLRFESPDTKIWFDVYDVVKAKSRKRSKEDITYIGYNDSEFGEYDIIRVNKLYANIDGKEYILEGNSPFRVKGFPRDVSSKWENENVVEVANPKEDISYVIKNTESVMEFKKLQELYTISTDGLMKKAKDEGYSPEDIKNGAVDYLNDQIKYMYDFIKPVIKGEPISVFECAIRNKIKSTEDGRIVPNWKEENPPYKVMTSLVAMREKPTISAILPRGYVYYRITDSTFHNVDNLRYSVFDLLFQDNKEEN